MTTEGKPLLTQKMTMHLNGGSKFSELHYAIQADGEPTGLRRIQRTDGSPKYLITADLIMDASGRDHFDVMATKGKGMEEWILAHLPPRRHMEDEL
jgi:hypothetical protein